MRKIPKPSTKQVKEDKKKREKQNKEVERMSKYKGKVLSLRIKL